MRRGRIMTIATVVPTHRVYLADLRHSSYRTGVGL